MGTSPDELRDGWREAAICHGSISERWPLFLCGSATGYLLVRDSGLWLLLSLAISILIGIGAGALVLRFIQALVDREAPLDPADYEMVGALGRLSLPIRVGGTGELIYSQEGTRRVAGARSEDGSAIPKGAEVMVVRYEKGIAYVRPWEDPTGDAELKI
jgi:membrane protein implicated in regulation of membrane protease activity